MQILIDIHIHQCLEILSNSIRDSAKSAVIEGFVKAEPRAWG